MCCVFKGLGQIVALLVWPVNHLTAKFDKSLQHLGADTVHIADDGVGNNAPFEAHGQGSVTGKNQRFRSKLLLDDLLVAPRSRRENKAG